MCGIVGGFALDQNAGLSGRLLVEMSVQIKHRGPDGQGYLTSHGRPGSSIAAASAESIKSSAASAPIALAHRRLAIIDLSDRASQPMRGHSGSTWIVFNGEIYNYRELADELRSAGREFNSNSDTEVLLAAYEHWGPECLQKICGMFAFAIWDERSQEIFCARDRLGIKPFYYTVTPDGLFLFASEIKSLLVHPDVSMSRDDEAAIEFLTHGNCDYGSRTLFRSIMSLEGGHFIRVRLYDPQSIRPRPYWSIRDTHLELPSGEKHIEYLRNLLIGVIDQHLISDVRVGSCLSGGLDSSTVVGAIGHIQRNAPSHSSAVGAHLKTFTSCWTLNAYDERGYALAVAEHVGADPELVFPSSDDFWNDFDRLSWHQDMPIGSLSFYAQWSVMKAASRAGVKVLLDGQGGDEVFGGYAKFRYAYLVSLARERRWGAALQEGWGLLAQGDRYLLDLRKGHRYLPVKLKRLLGTDSLIRHCLSPGWAQGREVSSSPASRWWENAKSGVNGHSSLMRKIQMDDLTIDTLPQLLRFEDRSSMAFSIEARVPLLDHRLVEFGINLPDQLKVKSGWSKFALRSAVTGLMPPNIQWRRTKLGFAAPNREWLAHDLYDKVRDVLSQPMRSEAYIDRRKLQEWYDSGRRLQANTESMLGLFRILALESWMRAYSLS